MKALFVLALAAGAVIAGATTTWSAPPGFAFLEIPVGARGSALGGAYASLVSGPEALFWNPGGLPGPKGLELSGGHTEWLQKLRHDYFATGGPVGPGVLAASVRALYSEAIDERDDEGNLIGSFGAHDLEFALGYGQRVSSDVSMGATASVLRERISNLAATTYAFGVGGAWEPNAIPGLRLAVAGQNLGPAAHYTIDGIRGEPVTLPAAVQTGLSYSHGLGSRLTMRIPVEGRLTRGRNAIGVVGAELGDLSGACLRMGVRMNDASSVMSFGAGYAMPGITLDYAFVPLRDDLGDTHRFAFTARF
jgi:hypothetical protein